jgi:hypothetical protein
MQHETLMYSGASVSSTSQVPAVIILILLITGLEKYKNLEIITIIMFIPSFLKIGKLLSIILMNIIKSESGRTEGQMHSVR